MMAAKKEMLKQELYGTFALLNRNLDAMERLLSANDETVGDIIERWTKTGEVDVPAELQHPMTRLLIEWASLSNAMWEIKESCSTRSKPKPVFFIS
jgi:hypothetical protein